MPSEPSAVEDLATWPATKKKSKKKKKTNLIDDTIESRSISRSPPAAAVAAELCTQEETEVKPAEELLVVPEISPLLTSHSDVPSNHAPTEEPPDDLLIEAIQPEPEDTSNGEERSISLSTAVKRLSIDQLKDDTVRPSSTKHVARPRSSDFSPVVTYEAQAVAHEVRVVPDRQDTKAARVSVSGPPHDGSKSPRSYGWTTLNGPPLNHTRRREPSLPDAQYVQNHVFAPPDLGIARSTEKSEVRMLRFDSFSNAGDQVAAAKASDILMVATAGVLDVYRLLPDKMETIARLEGLHGQVLDAKVISVGTAEDEHSAERPLVALVIHGPGPDDAFGRYESSLEIYSLRTQRHIATLYRGLPIASDSVPDPVGALRIDTEGSWITLSSGVSGEIWVFDALSFHAVGKFWTTLQEGREQALLALGKRWLVIVCPDSSSNISIQGMVSGSGHHVTSYNAPIPPPLTADVQDLDQEGVISRLSRQAAQEMLKATRKGVEIGWNGWREFTNPSQPAKRVESEFPPTHAPDIKRQVQPAIISIVDLARPLDGSFQRATFALQTGCNFLSLSPDGLRLVTTDRTGETSDIWDLSRAWYSTIGAVSTSGVDEFDGPAVKCLQRISRNSPSVVVEAVWSSNDRIALRTVAGTVHLHQVGPQRRALKSAATTSLSQGMSPPSSSFLGSITSSWQKVNSRDALLDTANTARAASGRLLARGLAQGYTMAKAGVHDAWHADDNKIRLPGAVSTRWLHESFAIATASNVFVYSVIKLGEKLKAERGRHEYTLLPPTASIGDPHGPHGFWTFRSLPVQLEERPEQDETETNPLSVAFHVDKRVSLFVYGEVEEHDVWCFGDDIPFGIKVNTTTDDLMIEPEEDEQVESVFRVDDT